MSFLLARLDLLLHRSPAVFRSNQIDYLTIGVEKVKRGVLEPTGETNRAFIRVYC